MQPMQSESVTRGQVKTDENKDDMRNVHRIEISTLSLLGEHVENICTNCLSCHVMSCHVMCLMGLNHQDIQFLTFLC